MVSFMSRNDIMHGHDNHRDVWLPLSSLFIGCRTHRYVAIIEGLNHSLERVLRDYKEITSFRQWKGKLDTQNNTRTYELRNIFIYYCGLMIPRSIIIYLRIHQLCVTAALHLRSYYTISDNYLGERKWRDCIWPWDDNILCYESPVHFCRAESLVVGVDHWTWEGIDYS